MIWSYKYGGRVESLSQLLQLLYTTYTMFIGKIDQSDLELSYVVVPVEFNGQLFLPGGTQRVG